MEKEADILDIVSNTCRFRISVYRMSRADRAGALRSLFESHVGTLGRFTPSPPRHHKKIVDSYRNLSKDIARLADFFFMILCRFDMKFLIVS